MTDRRAYVETYDALLGRTLRTEFDTHEKFMQFMDKLAARGWSIKITEAEGGGYNYDCVEPPMVMSK